jgi:hypothetical protein
VKEAREARAKEVRGARQGQGETAGRAARGVLAPPEKLAWRAWPGWRAKGAREARAKEVRGARQAKVAVEPQAKGGAVEWREKPAPVAAQGAAKTPALVRSSLPAGMDASIRERSAMDLT